MREGGEKKTMVTTMRTTMRMRTRMATTSRMRTKMMMKITVMTMRMTTKTIMMMKAQMIGYWAEGSPNSPPQELE